MKTQVRIRGKTGTPGVKIIAVLVLAAAFCAPGLPLHAQDDYKQGEDLFIRDKPQEALPYLERAFAEDRTHLETALYLAMCYEQLGKLDEAIAVYREILPGGGEQTALIACNLGNAYFRKGSAGTAEQFYTQAIKADPAYAPAYLNRANSRVKAGTLRDALQDYERYLVLAPDSAKRPQIEQLMGLIREEAAAEEIRRLTAGENARMDADRRRRQTAEGSSPPAPAEDREAAAAEEIRRLTAEENARAETDRRRRLREGVSASPWNPVEGAAGAEEPSGPRQD
ncbi:MAG: tetratricopeptide repeat protein [Treponema sp.]|nr:tetratricopeptide repeat protein [Treponema sp.]